jgi:hypothetical protein
MGRTRIAPQRAGRAAAVVIAVAGVLAAACATPGPGPDAAGPRAAVPARVVIPAGGSPAEARRAGRRMIASLILPAGSMPAAPRSRPPRPDLLGPNAVDVSRFYWLPLPEDAAFSFLQHHVPAGTSRAGTGLFGNAFPAVQYSLTAPPAGLEQFNQLTATLAAGRDGGTLLRADAELTWYPARSAAEYLPPGGYRSVTITATFTSSPAQAKPRTITRAVTSQAVIARLARLLDGLHATAPWMGSCPACCRSSGWCSRPRRPRPAGQPGCWSPRGDAAASSSRPAAGRSQPLKTSTAAGSLRTSARCLACTISTDQTSQVPRSRRQHSRPTPTPAPACETKSLAL